VGKVISTLITVVVAVGASAAIWVGANVVFNQVRHHWARFNGIAMGAVGFIVGVMLSGNRVTRGSEGGLLEWIWLPLVLAVALAVIAVVLASIDNPGQRLAIGIGAFALLGLGIGFLILPEYRPELEVIALVGWTAAGVAIGAGVDLLRKRPVVNGPLVGAALGFFTGAWGASDLGNGSLAEALIGATVPAALIGVRLGRTSNPAPYTRTVIDQRSRAVIFLAPAMLFIFATLIVPTIRTIYLSFLDRRSEVWVGLENYQATFTDPTSWNATNWTDMFGSRLFFIGMALLVVSLLIGLSSKKETGRAVELGGPTGAPLLVGAFFVAFAAFTAFRGTIVNNLWWVVTVTFASTALGLAIAVLADNAKLERVAKSIIFMPMAISLVGASIIWRFMYISRDTSLEQTGVMNAVWVGLGRLSTGSGIPTLVGAVVIGVVLVLLGVVLARTLVRRDYTRLPIPALAFFLVGWFFLRYIGSGVGGQRTGPTGAIVPDTVQFVQDGPFNNFWLMVILIWIQTGFAMVILSAAIKAVPEEFIEAARVDGATPSQIFWRITLPQISTTIGVVVTTLIVLVMKVYDIVKVVTNGNFGTQVLANDMFNQAFQFGNTGRGAALAVLILVSVLPVMYLNIRRMQEGK
jgi:alpha-glucoside transport system permease protein